MADKQIIINLNGLNEKPSKKSSKRKAKKQKVEESESENEVMISEGEEVVEYEKTVGNREEVWKGIALKTRGGLFKEDLEKNGRGRLVSKAASAKAKLNWLATEEKRDCRLLKDMIADPKRKDRLVQHLIAVGYTVIDPMNIKVEKIELPVLEEEEKSESEEEKKEKLE